jgi:Holliday junction resolvase
MMVRLKSPKDKGSGFERDIVKLLNDKLKYGEFKRVPGSGAMGTSLHEATLTGDVTGKILGIPRVLKIECKVGYGGETQLALKREWLNKIKQEAEQAYGFPIMIGKFSGARKADGVQEFAVLDIDSFIFLMNLISDLQHELDLAYEDKDG